VNPAPDRFDALVRGRSDAEEEHAPILPARRPTEQVRTEATA
jgi:hypothetical protein